MDDWWQAASPERREDFLKALRSGQMDVAALPCNQAPFLNAAQWQTMLHWIPEDLWQQCKPTVAVQNDVNGFPRAGAMALLDRGVQRLCIGINGDSGGPPMFRPSGFWWKMPDGRRLFVWLNLSYPDGYDFFETAHWRRGPVPFASDTRYRPPREGDFFRTDEASLRAAHAQCLRRIQHLQQGGYEHDVLTISMTNHWRMDNDPPFLPLAEFRGGLEPTRPETRIGLHHRDQGDGSDGASGRRARCRSTKANSPTGGPTARPARRARWPPAVTPSGCWPPPTRRSGDRCPPAATQKAHSLYKDLCLFDEHTWGSSWSVAFPWSLDTQAQFAEKAMLAWRPMGQAEWLLSQRVRSRLLPEGEGLFVANPSRRPFSGWVRMPVTCLRDDYRSLFNPATGATDAVAVRERHPPLDGAAEPRRTQPREHGGDVSRQRAEPDREVLDGERSRRQLCAAAFGSGGCGRRAGPERAALRSSLTNWAGRSPRNGRA